MQSILNGAAESPSTAIPRIAVPAAPMPVQTAYPVPTGSVRSENERRKTLDKPVATVNSPGINRVKPSDHFMQKANAISRMPAMLSSAHAIETDPFINSPSVTGGARFCESSIVRLVNRVEGFGDYYAGTPQ
jgi:hypothetical protein